MIGVNVRVDSHLVRDMLGRIQTHIPEVTLKDAKKIAETYSKSLQDGAPFWRGNLKASIQVVPTKDGYGVEMLDYGILLDGEGFGGDLAMTIHEVPTGFGSRNEPSPPFKEWIQEHNIGGTPLSSFKSIFVHPKPWINKSIQPVSEEMRNYFKSDKSELRKFLNKLGR